MSKNAFTLRYLARAASGVPRDLAQTLVASKLGPVRPTVLIYNCTWVCDARCEMCNNWKHGDRKADMTLPQLEPAMAHPFWGAVENLNISGGEPTTRNDLPEMVEMFHRHLPRMRKVGINTTGLTPHRAIPMLTRIVEFCAAHDLLLSVRVSLDGIGDIHNQVRHVQRGFDKACETIRTMPCPVRSQGLLLNPYGDLHYCEDSQAIGNVLTTPAAELYFRGDNLAHREHIKSDVCPTCLSPCQVNVGAMKQVAPYAKFLLRASRVKRDPSRHLETLPTQP